MDAIAIVVNGQLITDPDEIDTLASSGATLGVSYIFVQAGTATSFSAAKVGQIAYSVKDSFADTPTLTRDDDVAAAAEISHKVLDNARLFRNGNPTCSVYYATAGRWAGDNDPRARFRVCA